MRQGFWHTPTTKAVGFFPPAVQIVVSTRVAHRGESDTLYSKGQCPALSPEGDYLVLRVLFSECRITRSFPLHSNFTGV